MYDIVERAISAAAFIIDSGGSVPAAHAAAAQVIVRETQVHHSGQNNET